LFSLVRLDWLNGQQLLGQAGKPPTRRYGTQQLFTNGSAETKDGSAGIQLGRREPLADGRRIAMRNGGDIARGVARTGLEQHRDAGA
jgi:hypothetical protein